MKKHLIALMISVALVGCSSPAPQKVAPLKLDFSGPSPITLQVQNVSVVNRSLALPSRQAMPVFTPSLPDAVKVWARDRLATNGSPAQATLIIKDASVTAQQLPLQTGFESWFTRQQSHKYTAKVELDLEARSADGLKNAFATAHAMRTTTLPEDPTEAEKTQAYNDMVEGLMHDLDRDFESAIRQHMTQFIAPY